MCTYVQGAPLVRNFKYCLVSIHSMGLLNTRYISRRWGYLVRFVRPCDCCCATVRYIVAVRAMHCFCRGGGAGGGLKTFKETPAFSPVCCVQRCNSPARRRGSITAVEYLLYSYILHVRTRVRVRADYQYHAAVFLCKKGTYQVCFSDWKPLFASIPFHALVT